MPQHPPRCPHCLHTDGHHVHCPHFQTAMPAVTATVREIRHEVRIDLTDAPTLKNCTGRRRKPVGLRIEYGLRRDITRVDIVVEWDDAAERWPPSHEMPDWLRRIIDDYAPRDVDTPDTFRPTGMGGWPVRPANV